MKNYLEHETEVKFYDYVLAQKTDWQWFIDLIEENFDGYNEKINSWSSFMSSYRDIIDVYSYFVRINSINNIDVTFNTKWAKEIFLCSCLFNGKTIFEELWTQLECVFSKMFSIIVFITKLINSTNSTDYIATPSIFTQNNIYKLYNLEKVAEYNEVINKSLLEIALDGIEKIIECFNKNINFVEIEPNIDLLNNHKDKILNVNAFRYQRITIPSEISWEVQFIFDMLKIKIDKDEIGPLSTFKGVSYPNVKLWTEQVLNDLILYFDNEVASFVIETIRYVLYKNAPSEKTISYHFELLNDFLASQPTDASFHDLDVSSLLIVNSLLTYKMVSQSMKNKYMKDFLACLHKFTTPQTICLLKKHNFSVSKEQNEILSNYNKSLTNTIYDIKEHTAFFEFCKNENIIMGLNNKKLEESVKVFNSLIVNTDSVILSALFYEYMVFLLKLNNNINIDKAELKNIMIQLQKIWQQEYYDKCVDSMHTFSHKFEVTDSEIRQINEAFLMSSIVAVSKCMPIDRNNILGMMKTISEHILHIFCQNISITKTYPKYVNKNINGHDVDKAFVNLIEQLQTEKGYKMLNYVEPEKLLTEIYRNYEDYIQIYMSLFSNIEELYNKVKNKLPDYVLIDYDGQNLFFAHLLQLFPILENKIREFGIYCNIVPFKEKINEFLHMKDASSVLQQILLEVYSNTESFDGVEDFFFIYQCMYNGNFLNIRNEACHGRDFLGGSRLFFAFKTTLLCLDLILDRLIGLNKNIKQD